ncbi:MAG: purine-nucleoside phosphorylase [Oscillospiraceae bacterium]
MEDFTYSFYKKSADYILSKIKVKPEIALVLGSGLGSISDEIKEQTIINYNDIPNFLHTTVKSHLGKLIFGQLGGKNVVCMSGRFHYYEGYDFEQLAAPIRVFKLIGVEKTILTNAAGAINTQFKVGDLMIINDHIKLAGASPMRGKNIEEFGDRFFDVSDMYTKELRNIAWNCVKKLGQSDCTHDGIYYYAGGPQFETPAEIRAMRMLGGDAVGMSTVTEAITAAHCNMKLLALSLMTNMAAGVLDKKLTSEEVDVAALEASGRLKVLIKEIVKEI